MRAKDVGVRPETTNLADLRHKAAMLTL